jgi:hypothetical protein
MKSSTPFRPYNLNAFPDVLEARYVTGVAELLAVIAGLFASTDTRMPVDSFDSFRVTDCGTSTDVRHRPV